MLWDITPPLTPDIGVWPGDTPLSRSVALDIAKGDNITLSSMNATVHLGAHADAPSHYGAGGRTIDAQRLTLYIGPCQVLRVHPGRGARITPAMLPREVAAPRVLLRTDTFSDARHWNKDFAALDPTLIDYLGLLGVRLIGIDTPSIDLFDSKDLPAHQSVFAHDMAVLEGLRLEDVPDGFYELIALPLPLVGFDASPVRAVLRPLT